MLAESAYVGQCAAVSVHARAGSWGNITCFACSSPTLRSSGRAEKRRRAWLASCRRAA
jgi:hypothetical protein